MKRQHFLTAILAVFFMTISFNGIDVYAQNSISGDGVCGATAATKCGIGNLKQISQSIFSLIIGIGLPLLVVAIIYRFVVAWYSLQQGNANAYREAGKKATEAIIGFVIIVAIFGGVVLAMLKYLGVKDGTDAGGFNPLFLLNKLFSVLLIPHAYAAGEALPNPLGFSSLYDFILGTLNLVMKFFLYPAMIGIWVWSGFLYVAAQGAPEKIKKAHNLLLWAVISTLVVFMTQGFLTAVKGSVNKILPGSAATTVTNTQGTPDGRVAPAPGETGSVCNLPGGGYGIMAAGNCVSSARGPTTDTSGTPDGRVAPAPGADGSVCTLPSRAYGIMAGGVCISSARGNTRTDTVDCRMIATKAACEASISSATWVACKWTGGSVTSAMCSN